MSNLRAIKDILYQLKHEFGLPLNIIWRESSSPDLDTGLIAVELDSVRVRRAIALPSRLDRDFEYDLSFIASNKNFTYGGFFDKVRRRIIVDRSDLPTDFEIKVGYYLAFDGRRYEVEAVDETEERAGYLIIAKQETQVQLKNLIKRSHFSTLFLTQTVEAVVE